MKIVQRNFTPGSVKGKSWGQRRNKMLTANIKTVDKVLIARMRGQLIRTAVTEDQNAEAGLIIVTNGKIIVQVELHHLSGDTGLGPAPTCLGKLIRFFTIRQSSKCWKPRKQ